MDLNKKVSFACDKSQLELPEEYDQNDADYVDCECFWEKVELAMLVRGFPRRTVPEFEVQTQLLSWSPFIGKMTRKNDLLLNTEHRKIDRNSGELERDCRDITEERLLELLNNSTSKEVSSFVRTLGLKPKGTKLDVVMQVKHAISKDDATFKKAFKQLWGCSGGWVSGTCPHGVIYALKFVLRAESPRDYVDLILSMEHQPNIIISDMANMVVAHGNKRERNMFSPFNGMVAEPTKSNVQEALAGTLEVSLPWLDGEAKDCKASHKKKSERHPFSGSEHHLCLFDRLHEKNVKKDEEALRRVTNVKELKGKLNSQKDEQLHAAYNHDSRYLNQMKAVNHIFLFRSNIDIRNDNINQRLEAGLVAAFKHKLSLDENGQAVIDKARPVKCPKMKRRPDEAIVEEKGSDVQSPQMKREKSRASDSIKNTANERDISNSSDDEQPCNLDTRPSDPNSSDDLGSRSKPIEVSKLKERPLAAEDKPWIAELGLKGRDKQLIEGGHWLNDRIINAAMQLVRNVTYEKGIGGLQDVVVGNACRFSDSGGLQPGFVQVINVRGNHWITLSNLLCTIDQTCVYDSYLDLNVKTALKKISYPVEVDIAACELAKREKSFTMLLEEIQQQEGGNDCGLFAIAYAVLLCFN